MSNVCSVTHASDGGFIDIIHCTYFKICRIKPIICRDKLVEVLSLRNYRKWWNNVALAKGFAQGWEVNSLWIWLGVRPRHPGVKTRQWPCWQQQRDQSLRPAWGTELILKLITMGTLWGWVGKLEVQRETLSIWNVMGLSPSCPTPPRTPEEGTEVPSISGSLHTDLGFRCAYLELYLVCTCISVDISNSRFNKWWQYWFFDYPCMM